MSLGERLRQTVGKDIKQICPNRFHDPAANHCAHFASHMCGMTFSFSCVDFKGGGGDEGNVRVHEIFAQCPRVGRWNDADRNKTQLIFVTLDDNVDVARKRMVNIPQKHIGVYHDGTVFHYGNTADKVVTDTPDTFFQKFQRLYDGDQGLFFGWIPGEDLRLNVVASATDARAAKAFDLPDPVDGVWRAREKSENDGFLIGRETRDEDRDFFGIFVPQDQYWGPVFSAADHARELHQWATLLEVTGACESANRFNLVNTYDRAKFTFGFYQLAAHTPKDNLILLFRRLAELPAFSDYFPDLKMVDDKLTRVDADGSRTSLETEFPTGGDGSAQLQLFMNYLNPNRRTIERQEALQAARLIHWTVNDPAARRAQVMVAAEILQGKMMRRYAPKLRLDGKSDLLCAIVADIFHQGRSTFSQVRPMLTGANAADDLLHVNEDRFSGRNKHLRAAVKKAVDQGRLGRHAYVAATNEFRPV